MSGQKKKQQASSNVIFMESIFKAPHLRKNILTGEKVLVSPHRTQRPWQGKLEEESVQEHITYDPSCYLCPNNTRANKAINPDYKHTFVFINDYAALKPDITSEVYHHGLLEAKSEKGICKVICFSPNHSLTLSRMSIEAIKRVIETWQAEFKTLSEKPFINYVQIFENRGEIMGCSNPHPHGQIWAQDSIPDKIHKKTSNFLTYYKKHQRSLLEDYVQQELREEERMIFENEHFVVLVPFWAVWPYETMIIPKVKEKNIMSMHTDKMRHSFAEAMKTITKIYDGVFQVPFPYSSGIHQAPSDQKKYEGWHWHMSFYPPLLRSATIKKFMVGYEMFAYPQRDITAEMAAQRLREIMK